MWILEKSRGKQIRLCLLVLILAAFVIWVVWSNYALEESLYRIINEHVPQEFDGFRIAQISDLHNAEFGRNNGRLIAYLSEVEPDLIVITGDMIDSRRTDVEIALNLAENMVEICPVYYVNGNHEARIAEYEVLKAGLEAAGVIILENRKVEISRNAARITLMGVSDPSFQADYLFGDAESVMKTAIEQLQHESDGFTILLSHRPELFDVYVETGIDLVLSGHTHGGQFRLPFLGGLVAPNQGFFPEYDAGQYAEENTTMIICRGLGASVVPVRFNNRPEIVLIELCAGE